MSAIAAHPASPTISDAPPRPLAPLGGAVVDGTAVTFQWKGVPDTERYRIEVSPERQFARDVSTFDAGASTELTLVDALPATHAALFWRVRAEAPAGPTRWSAYGRFRLGTDAAVEAFQAQQEAARAELHKALLHRQAEETAARDLIPLWQREDTGRSDREGAMVGLAMIVSFVLTLLLVLAATVAG